MNRFSTLPPDRDYHHLRRTETAEKPPTHVYGCHSRAPFLDHMTLAGGKTVPFTGSTACQYTLSDLGRADAQCLGCSWRKP